MSHLGDEDLSPLLSALAARIDGEVHADSVTRMLYAVDASPYQELPLAAVRPRHGADCAAIVRFAARHRIPLIPRAAGTSLAGQCVGNGLVVDVSRHMTEILEIDCERRRVRVQPGVILEDLNDALAPNGLMFGPDTSTANRCMIGGMIGNNACGSHSILYGTTRDHVLEVEAILGDGSVTSFGPLDKNALQAKLDLDTLEGRIYREVFHAVDDHRRLILDRYPGPDVLRRNTGYALDVLARGQPWAAGGPEFNLAPFLCGSEGTLAIITEAVLNLVAKPTSRLLVCAHFDSLDGALRATLVTVRHDPAAVELIDRRILEPTRGHLEQRHNRFWIEGDPEAVLIIELSGADTKELARRARDLVNELQRIGLGYAFPVVGPPRMSQVWELRAAGLGLLMGVPGDVKAVTVIEDTAVAVAELPEYVRRIQALMEKYQTRCVYYGHASVGLLHLRPELNLKQPEGIEKFKALAAEVADLVAEFGGSLSGEHGDGRLRGPFVARVLGKEIYEILCRIKSVFDPLGIFNPHKVTAAFPIDRDLRVKAPHAEIPVHFDWSADQGFLRAAEKCNGAGACRKSAGRGTMCPSYMATLEEKHSTRGRANVFRQVLSSPDPLAGLTSAELREVLDLCLACKGCKSECPAAVDMARMKAEFMQHYHDRHGVPLRARVLGGFGRLNRMAARFPDAATAFINHTRVKRLLGIHEQRRIPALARQTFSRWFSTRAPPASNCAGRDVLLFNDLFTEFHEPEIGIAAVGFLERAGYRVGLTEGIESGRVAISQGFLRQATRMLNRSIAWLYPHASEGTAILGLEPSEILTFRDEAPDLVASRLRAQARTVAERTLLFEEFVAGEARAGKLGALAFNQNPCHILVHGHCHQKALAGMQPLLDALAILPHAKVETIPSGCCGMAGAFGYEREHYEVSMRIGELVLFPAVRAAAPETLIVAPGTSCRHQIADGTGRRAYHPAELLSLRLP